MVHFKVQVVLALTALIFTIACNHTSFGGASATSPSTAASAPASPSPSPSPSPLPGLSPAPAPTPGPAPVPHTNDNVGQVLHFKFLCTVYPANGPSPNGPDHRAELQAAEVHLNIDPDNGPSSVECDLSDAWLKQGLITSQSIDFSQVNSECTSHFPNYVQYLSNVFNTTDSQLTIYDGILNRRGLGSDIAWMHWIFPRQTFDTLTMATSTPFTQMNDFVLPDGSLGPEPLNVEPTILINWANVHRDSSGNLTPVNAGDDVSRCQYLQNLASSNGGPIGIVAR